MDAGLDEKLEKRFRKAAFVWKLAEPCAIPTGRLAETAALLTVNSVGRRLNLLKAIAPKHDSLFQWVMQRLSCA